MRIEDVEPPTLQKGAPCTTYKGSDEAHHGSLCFLENDEWQMIDALVRPHHTVLEVLECDSNPRLLLDRS